MSPRSAKQLEEIREQSREKILGAAFELFATKGYHSTSIAQIAKKAGVAKGLIYNYFEKKEDLMVGIVTGEFAKGDDVLGKIMSAESSKERLKIMIEIATDSIVKQQKQQKLMAQLSLQLHDFPQLEEMIKGRYINFMPFMTQIFKEIGYPEPEKEARYFSAMMDGFAMQYLVIGDALPIQQIKEDIINRYCK